MLQECDQLIDYRKMHSCWLKLWMIHSIIMIYASIGWRSSSYSLQKIGVVQHTHLLTIHIYASLTRISQVYVIQLLHPIRISGDHVLQVQSLSSHFIVNCSSRSMIPRNIVQCETNWAQCYGSTSWANISINNKNDQPLQPLQPPGMLPMPMPYHNYLPSSQLYPDPATTLGTAVGTFIFPSVAESKDHCTRKSSQRTYHCYLALILQLSSLPWMWWVAQPDPCSANQTISILVLGAPIMYWLVSVTKKLGWLSGSACDYQIV